MLQRDLALSLAHLGWMVWTITAVAGVLGAGVGLWLPGIGAHRALLLGLVTLALQPVASATRTDHIGIDRDLQKQYEAIYSGYDLLRPELPALQENLLDLRRAFDRDEYIYIDADQLVRTATPLSPRQSALS
ncbi:MAG TPA: hypothetical protein VFZ10_07425 [Geminicoccaceae bacterium]